MNELGAPETDEWVANRYRVVGTLGQGGMAIVYQVLDSATGQALALKRMIGASSQEQRDMALFEREYLTLARLAHPRVVRAYDYGVEEQGPYYTMELLDGGDLQRLAPIDYRKACALLSDVCSALSLLHSRRMVYRDLSPRNVRCTGNGMAKLIDFGAMTPMGPSREWVGTLPFCAPEALHSQPLDARTDLYALGATLYYALTSRHAYPARDAGHLIDLWQSKPPPPSELVPGIPSALDALILDLLAQDPQHRPASAAEVMERLSAIADLPIDEQLLVSQAYLSTPTLVGREGQLDEIRKRLGRALRRRGGSLLLQGVPGV
ncbi:MAG TPA: serine/threonine-protein kinase, partial [Polyangiaceae bacterium]|nr:serine/threonine-protein kinase [Polyangiaceae bacterium]